MDVDAGVRAIDREKTSPFLIRTFVHVGSFHALSLFDAGKLPLGDEHPIYTWKDATLKEILTTLRVCSPRIAELRHPQGRYAFQAVLFQAEKRGQYNKKDLGMVYSRDIIGEPGTLEHPSMRLLDDEEKKNEGLDTEKTLEDLLFVPGDYLCVSVILPKNAKLEVGIKGAAAAAAAAAPSANGTRDLSGGFSAGPPRGVQGLGRGGGGGGHWRGASDAPSGRRPARGGRGDVPPRRGIDRDDDRRSPPPRRYGGRDSPPPRRTTPPRRGGGGYGRDRRSRSGSRSPRRRNSRYD